MPHADPGGFCSRLFSVGIQFGWITNGPATLMRLQDPMVPHPRVILRSTGGAAGSLPPRPDRRSLSYNTADFCR